jgi:hypothetical protein
VVGCIEPEPLYLFSARRSEYGSEYVLGQLARGAGEDGFDPGAGAGQAGGGTRIKALLLPQPGHGAVEALTGLAAMSEPVLGNGQEEEVEGLEPAAVGGATALEGGDGVVVTARSIIDDPPAC